MADVGALIGGFLAVLVLSLFWEWALMKRVVDDPLKGKTISVILAWLTAGLIGGWGFADGGAYQWRAFGSYFFPALPVFALAVRAGLRSRAKEA